MELKVVGTNPEISEVALVGDLDIAGVEQISIKFTAHTVTPRRDCIVDMTGVGAISSFAIGLLVRSSTALRAEGARMVLVGPQPLVLAALKATRIPSVIPVVDSHEAALEVFRTPAIP